LLRTVLKNSPDLHCYFVEEEFRGITLRNLKCGENRVRNYTSNNFTGYAKREIIRTSYEN